MAAAPKSIDTNVQYFLSPENGGGPTSYYIGTVGARRRKFDPHAVKVTNIRGKEEFFSLDTHGFELAHYPAQEKEFADPETISKGYYREVEKRMKELTGASHVYVFSHVVRRDSHQKALDMPKELRDEEPIALATPAMFAHIDQSYNGAKILVDSIHDRDNAAAEVVNQTKNHRWAIINAWRPLKPVTREPLAVCDARTVAESDLREITLKIPTQLPTWVNSTAMRTGIQNSPYGPDRENPTKQKPSQKLWQLVANPQHRWYWPSRMMPEEVLLIKCFDSRTDVARRAPHSAIQTPMDQGPARESIEVRCVVVWDDQAPDNERAML